MPDQVGQNILEQTHFIENCLSEEEKLKARFYRALNVAAFANPPNEFDPVTRRKLVQIAIKELLDIIEASGESGCPSLQSIRDSAFKELNYFCSCNPRAVYELPGTQRVISRLRYEDAEGVRLFQLYSRYIPAKKALPDFNFVLSLVQKK